ELGLIRHARRIVVARVEEELNIAQVADTVPSLDVLVGDAREVVSGHERAGGQPKHFDKLREITVLVQCRAWPRQRDTVVRGEFGERCRTHRTHDVYMQLRLGEAREPRRE